MTNWLSSPKKQLAFCAIILGCVLPFLLGSGSVALAEPIGISANLAPGSTILVPQDHATIQAGIDAAQDGDLVLVSPGTYNENLTLSGKTITLASLFHTTGDESAIAETIIDGGGRTVITVDGSVGPETQIIGFTIQNGVDGILTYAKLHILNNYFTGHKDAIDYEGGGGICRDNVFENNSDDAIDLDGAAEGIIEGNIIRSSANDGMELRFHEYSGPTLEIFIRNNTITGSGEDGIQLIDYPDLSDRVLWIERNLIEDSAMVGLGLMADGNTTEDYSGASIPERIHLFNNTFVNNPYALTGGANLIALNNLFVNSPVLAMKNVNVDSEVAYNLFWNNGVDAENSNIDSSTTFNVDPLLDADYHLQADSPAIDAGAAQYVLTSGETVLDLPVDAYNGVAPDLGMFESDQTVNIHAPSVTISAPSNGDGFNEGENITFTGSAIDLEDGDITANLVWLSDLDGNIGTGGSFARADLTAGSHTITATVTDSENLSGRTQITLTVGNDGNPQPDLSEHLFLPMAVH